MRTKFAWDVQLQAADGNVVQERVEAFWSPEHDGTEEGVKGAAVAQAWFRSGKAMQHVAVSAVPLGAVA